MMNNDYELRMRFYDGNMNIIFDDKNNEYEIFYENKNYDYYEDRFDE